MNSVTRWLETKRRKRLLAKAATLKARSRGQEALRLYDAVGFTGNKEDPKSLELTLKA